jgi:hypothetical protein
MNAVLWAIGARHPSSQVRLVLEKVEMTPGLTLGVVYTTGRPTDWAGKAFSFREIDQNLKPALGWVERRSLNLPGRDKGQGHLEEFCIAHAPKGVKPIFYSCLSAM